MGLEDPGADKPCSHSHSRSPRLFPSDWFLASASLPNISWSTSLSLDTLLPAITHHLHGVVVLGIPSKTSPRRCRGKPIAQGGQMHRHTTAEGQDSCHSIAQAGERICLLQK